MAEQARLVRIDYDRLPEYAASLPLDRLARPEIDAEHHYLADEPGTVAFFVTLDAINFGSGYFPHLRKRPGMSGYFTVATSLTERFRGYGPLDRRRTGPNDRRRVHRGVRPGSSRHDGRRTDALVRPGAWRFGPVPVGPFRRQLCPARGSGRRLGRSLGRPCSARCRCSTTSVATVRKWSASSSGPNSRRPIWRWHCTAKVLGRFHDLDRLTIFADNLVPHVLRVDGVLRYPDELIARIDREELIPAGSPEEVEIRAVAVHAVELIRAHLEKTGRAVNSMALDYVLWNRGQATDLQGDPPASHPHRLLLKAQRMSWCLETERLLLVPGTAELVQADLAGHGALEQQLQAIVPESWPPELLVDALPTFRDQLQADPSQVGWWLWYWILKPDAAQPATLIGSGGFCGLAPEGNATETGYSVLEPYQGRGLAAEAVGALMTWAFSHPAIETVIAHTYPHLGASIRVLEKSGFQLAGPGAEPDTIRFELRRPT